MNKPYITSSIAALLLLLTLIPSKLHAQTDSNAITIARAHTLHSKILGEDRKLYIHTPAGMKKEEAYPVLYLLDGGEHIEMVAGQITYLSESYRIIPQMIVVGIANTDRVRDLTPTHSLIGPDGKPDSSANAMGRRSGGGETFLRFMREELMPYIEANYPTAPYRIISGHSLGGLLGLYALAYHPGDFNACIAISPSLQWDNGSLQLGIADKLGHAAGGKKILFFSDGSEGGGFHQNQLTLDSLLRNKNPGSLKWVYKAYPEEAHAAVPVKAFYDGIRTIYPEWYLPFSNAAFRKTVRADQVKDHFARLSKIYGYKVIPGRDELQAIGRFLSQDTARINDAIELLRINAANYPKTASVHEALGDVYAKAADTAAALISYKKAVQLAPAPGPALQAKLDKLNQSRP